MRIATLILLALVPLASCETETRVISSRGSLLAGQPGAEGGLDAAGRPLRSEGPTTAERMNNPMGYPEPEGVDPMTLRVTDTRGEQFIVSRNPRELFFHIRRALVDQDAELLYEQILSKATIETYLELGRDPREAASFMLEHRAEIVRLMQFFPMADMTPGYFPKNIGRNQFRLEAPPGFANPPLKFRRIDYVYERDACRLLLIH
ncbi:MAG: hypothetical protein ACTS27_05890 [Phycisphaerales bacterium]